MSHIAINLIVKFIFSRMSLPELFQHDASSHARLILLYFNLFFLLFSMNDFKSISNTEKNVRISRALISTTIFVHFWVKLLSFLLLRLTEYLLTRE